MAATYIVDVRYSDDRTERSEHDATTLFYAIGDLWFSDEDAPESVTINKKEG